MKRLRDDPSLTQPVDPNITPKGAVSPLKGAQILVGNPSRRSVGKPKPTLVGGDRLGGEKDKSRVQTLMSKWLKSEAANKDPAKVESGSHGGDRGKRTRMVYERGKRKPGSPGEKEWKKKK